MTITENNDLVIARKLALHFCQEMRSCLTVLLNEATNTGKPSKQTCNTLSHLLDALHIALNMPSQDSTHNRGKNMSLGDRASCTITITTLKSMVENCSEQFGFSSDDFHYHEQGQVMTHIDEPLLSFIIVHALQFIKSKYEHKINLTISKQGITLSAPLRKTFGPCEISTAPSMTLLNMMLELSGSELDLRNTRSGFELRLLIASQPPEKQMKPWPDQSYSHEPYHWIPQDKPRSKTCALTT